MLLGTAEQEYLNKGGTLVNGSIPSLSAPSYTDQQVNAANATGNILPTTVPIKPVSILSTDNAKEKITKDLGSLNTMSPTTSPTYTAPTEETPTKETEKKQDSDKTIFINPATGQEYTFNTTDLQNKSNQDFIKNNGLNFMSGATPSFLAQPDTSTPEGKLQTNLDEKNKQVEDLTNEWLGYSVDSDPAFQAKAASITAQYSQLKQAMEKQNESRMKAFKVLGLRSGTSQYAGGVQMGIEGEELTQANQRMAELNQAEADAISSARQAYQTGKWSEFSNKVGALQKIRDNKADELKTYSETLAKNIKAIQDATTAADKKVYDEVTKPINDIITNLGKSNTPVPPEVIDAVSNAPSLAEAVKAAGSYLADIPTSGIVGEYLFYKKEAEAQGQTPLSFNDYQTFDANRKAKAAANAGDLSPSQQTILTNTTGSFENSPIVKTFVDIQNKYQNVKNNVGKGDGASDIALIYDLMKSLDPSSVVRETEYDTGASKSGNIFKGAAAKFNGMIKADGGFISETAKTNILDLIKNRFDVAKKQYVNLRDEKIRTLNNRGIKDAGNYLTEYDYDSSNNPVNQIIQTNTQAQDTIQTFHDSSPEHATLIDSLGEAFPEASFMEIYQKLKARGLVQ